MYMAIPLSSFFSSSIFHSPDKAITELVIEFSFLFLSGPNSKYMFFSLIMCLH